MPPRIEKRPPQSATELPIAPSVTEEQIDEDLVSVVKPADSTPEIDPPLTYGTGTGPLRAASRKYEVGLPSNFHFNTWKSLKIRKLAYPDLELNAEAKATNNEKLVIDIVQDCIDRPVEELTWPDFRYLLYWLRLESYTRSPLLITWHCDACKWRHRLKNDLAPHYEFTPAELHQFERLAKVMKPQLTINTLDNPLELEPLIDVPRMGCYLEYIKFLDEHEDQDVRYLATVATYVRGNNLSEKLDLLKAQEDLELYESARNTALALGSRYGVLEKAGVRCNLVECGATYSVGLNMKLLTFLVP